MLEGAKEDRAVAMTEAHSLRRAKSPLVRETYPAAHLKKEANMPGNKYRMIAASG